MERYAKAGFMPTYKADEGRGHRRERDGSGLPAEHRRRLVHDGDRHLPVRARLDEQHLLPRRRQLRQPDVILRRRRAAGGHDRERGRARGQEGRPDRLGRRRAPRTSTARRSTSRTSSQQRRARWRLRPGRQAGAAAFGVTYEAGRLRRRAGWTGVPAGDPAAPAEGDDVCLDRRPTFAAAEPEPHLQRLLLRQRRRTATANYDHAIVATNGKTDAGAVDRPRGRRLPGRSS